MPIGVPMVDLRRLLRAETGQSVNPAQGVQAQAAQDVKINRQQRELWDAYEWPHLQFWCDKSVAEGQSTFAYPAEMAFDQINRLYWSGEGDSQWKELTYGIAARETHPLQPVTGSPTKWSNFVDVSVAGVTEPFGSLVLHPVPDRDGLLRFAGMAPLQEMVQDADKCIIDSDAIVLFAAAEALATQKAEVAQLILKKAQDHLRRLLTNNGAAKRRNYNMGGSMRSSAQSRPVPYIDYIP